MFPQNIASECLIDALNSHLVRTSIKQLPVTVPLQMKMNTVKMFT